MRNPTNTYSGVVTFRAYKSAEPEYRVQWGGRLCSPCWASRGPALVYLSLLLKGKRQPEYTT